MGTSRKTALYQGSCAALFSIPPFGMDWGGALPMLFFFSLLLFTFERLVVVFLLCGELEGE